MPAGGAQSAMVPLRPHCAPTATLLALPMPLTTARMLVPALGGGAVVEAAATAAISAFHMIVVPVADMFRVLRVCQRRGGEVGGARAVLLPRAVLRLCSDPLHGAGWILSRQVLARKARMRVRIRGLHDAAESHLVVLRELEAWELAIAAAEGLIWCLLERMDEGSRAPSLRPKLRLYRSHAVARRRR